MIEDPPLLTIAARPARGSVSLDAFRDVPTGWLVDAMEGRGAMDAAIKPLAPDPNAAEREIQTGGDPAASKNGRAAGARHGPRSTGLPAQYG